MSLNQRSQVSDRNRLIDDSPTIVTEVGNAVARSSARAINDRPTLVSRRDLATKTSSIHTTDPLAKNVP
jgi:hypothetical protein